MNTQPTRLSRSARNRLARDSRGTKPSGTVPARAKSVAGNSPHDLAHNQHTGIRAVGYLGRNRTSVKYAGSGTDGYRSEWAMRGFDFYTDKRWDKS